MKCPKCGEEIANESMFCEYCGAQIHKANVSNAECQVHIKWLLYVAMLFTCILNYFLLEVQTYEADIVAFCLLLVQLSIFIPTIVLLCKKKIALLVLVSSFFMLIGNVLLWIDTIMFDGYIHFADGSKIHCDIYGSESHLSFYFILVAPIILLLCTIYESYSYRKI